MIGRPVNLTSPVLAGPFTSSDPRIDGVSAPIGTRWAATDCPIRMTKTGSGNTDWSLDESGEAIVARCRTAAEVNALYRGITRQPTLDFSPAHLLIPDIDNDRLTDAVAGHHLTRQGLGSGATIERSPLGDGINHAQVINGNASYYQATSDAHYAVTTEAFVIGAVWATTRNADGAIAFGKYADPGTSGDGYGVTSNAGGLWGFLVNGAGGDLNIDNYTLRADDGRARLFHYGRSITDSRGFMKTAGAPVIEHVGLAGNIATNVSTKFGIRNDNGSGSVLASGDHQIAAMLFWTGAAAENVNAYLDEIEEGLGLAHPPQTAAAIVSPQAAATPTRALGVAFLPAALRPVWCSYTIRYDSGGTSDAYVALKCDASNPPTTVRARSGGGIAAVLATSTSQLTFLVPAGWYVKLDQVDVVAGGTCAIVEQFEMVL